MKTTVVHCMRDAYDVLIDRRTNYGNPFTIGGLGHGGDGTREEVVWKYERWLLTGANFGNVRATELKRRWILQHVHELRGKRLGCWCAPKLCHGNVLARIADGELAITCK